MHVRTRPRAGGLLTTLSTRAYGVAFLLVIALLLGLSVASFQKRFTPVVLVDLMTDHVGNQLQTSSDVKVRGLIVGEVRTIETTGEGARIQLAISPDQVGSIPANVSARLLPKTLFGERYVDLVLPTDPSRRHLTEGDTIPQDRSSVAIELEQVFDNLLPLLRTVRPADLAATLNALSSALEGRGARLGQNLDLVDDYLKALNPTLPTLKQDITGLADVAALYADAAPDLLRLLRNLAVTNSTIASKQADLAGFLAGTAGFARTATTVLNEDDDRIIRLGRVSRPTLAVLAKYSPEYPCLAEGLDKWRSRISSAFAGNALHITLEVAPQRPAYQPGEEPSWQDRRGPRCYGLPSPPGTQAKPYPGQHFRDGTSGGAGSSGSAVPSSLLAGGPAGYVDPQSGSAGTAAEQAVTDALFSPLLGTSPDRMPDISNLLLGPMARGTQVAQR